MCKQLFLWTIRKSHPVFALSLGLLSTPNPSFSGGSNPQSKETQYEMLHLSI
jgi:hypothetical protein